MFGKDLKKQRARKPVVAKNINQFIAPVSGLMKFRVGSGLSMKWLNGTPIPSANPEAVILEAKTGGSGIAVASSDTQMTSGTVEVWNCDSSGTLTDGLRTVTAWNKDTASAVGANKQVLLMKNRAGLWVVVWEQC